MQVNKHPKFVVDRLIALWAFTESGLGGLLHAFKSPFTGIIIGGMAVTLLTLIAKVSNFSIKAITRAVTIVLIIKLLVSPQSPVGAYVAVAFQGCMAMFIFKFSRNLKVGAVLLAVLAMVESAVQKVLITTLLFGTDIWKAIDEFGKSAAKNLNLPLQVDLSAWIIGLYILIYLLAGILIGRYAGQLPYKLEELTLSQRLNAVSGRTVNARRRSKYRWLTAMLVIAGLAVIYLYKPSGGNLAYLYPMLRVIFIVLAWYLLIGPLLGRIIAISLKKKQSAYATDVQQALAFFPAIRWIAAQAWQQSRSEKLINRYPKFALRLIGYTLLYQSDQTDNE